MNYCQNCGDAVGEKSRYCKKCGSFLKSIEKFSLEEKDRKFCQNCGSAMGNRYCPACGSFGKDVKLKSSVLNVGKFFKGTDNSNKTIPMPTQTGKIESKNIKDLFSSLFHFKENLTVNLVNAGIFALMLSFLLGIIVFACNEAIVQWFLDLTRKQYPEIELLVLKNIEKYLDFKSGIWMLITGNAIKGTTTDGIAIDVGSQSVLPFIGFPILILLIWLMEIIRKAVLKTKRTFHMVVMQSGIFALFSGILSFVFTNRQHYSAKDELWYYVYNMFESMGISFGDSIKFSSGCSVISVFFSMFIISFVSLLLLPGLKVEQEIWKEIRKTITVFFGVILGMTLIPGMITAAFLVKRTALFDVKSGILLFIIATGMYSVAIFTGNLKFLDTSITLPEVLNNLDLDNSSFAFQAKGSWTKFFCSISTSEFSGSNEATKSSTPFSILMILLILIGCIATLYISAKAWEKLACDWKMAAVLSTVIGAGCATFLGLLHRLCCIGININYSSSNLGFTIGTKGVVANFIKETIAIGILCMAGYLIWYFAMGKIKQYMIAKVQWVLLGACGCCLVFSLICVSNIRLKSFRPVVENFVIECIDTQNEYGDYYYENEYSSVVSSATEETMKQIDRQIGRAHV